MSLVESGGVGRAWVGLDLVVLGRFGSGCVRAAWAGLVLLGLVWVFAGWVLLGWVGSDQVRYVLVG